MSTGINAKRAVLYQIDQLHLCRFRVGQLRLRRQRLGQLRLRQLFQRVVLRAFLIAGKQLRCPVLSVYPYPVIRLPGTVLDLKRLNW